jgi:SRSO17 transposase
VAAGHRVVPARWRALFEQVMDRVAGRFARVEPRRRVRQMVLGLMADLPRKNCWTIAEHVGDRSPDGLQHLLGRAVWDADAVRDDVRDLVVEHLADPDAVLVVDETGDVKKGTRTVGVQRQYSGTAGRVENCQVAVYLTYASRHGHAGIDRAVYLPAGWADDPGRRQAAGVPDGVGFATKPLLALAMIEQALDAGVPANWVTGDEVYGDNPALRAALEARGIGYVLAVSASHHAPTAAGPVRVDRLTSRLPRRAWQTLSAGAGAKGHRLYQWAWVDLRTPDALGRHRLLVRRNRTTGELAYYHCFHLEPVPLATLVRVAGSRWTIEETFQSSKTLTGLDEHQVRRWTSWHRWVTLALLAHAFLAITTALERRHTPTTTDGTSPHGLIPLTCNEIQHLFTALQATTRDTIHLLHWSTWRRRHQARARHSHYQRQQTLHT